MGWPKPLDAPGDQNNVGGHGVESALGVTICHMHIYDVMHAYYAY